MKPKKPDAKPAYAPPRLSVVGSLAKLADAALEPADELLDDLAFAGRDRGFLVGNGTRVLH